MTGARHEASAAAMPSPSLMDPVRRGHVAQSVLVLDPRDRHRVWPREQNPSVERGRGKGSPATLVGRFGPATGVDQREIPIGEPMSRSEGSHEARRQHGGARLLHYRQVVGQVPMQNACHHRKCSVGLDWEQAATGLRVAQLSEKSGDSRLIGARPRPQLNVDHSVGSLGNHRRATHRKFGSIVGGCAHPIPLSARRATS